jgi:lipopolysaccharide export system protein LptA
MALATTSTLTGAARFALALVAAALLATGAFAQETERQSSNFRLSNDEPIQIESNELVLSEADGKAVFTGNVEVVQGEMLLKSGEMTVFYSGDSGSVSTGTAAIERIELSNEVFLQSGAQTASADAGTYNMETERLTLSGERVVLSEGENILVGCKLTVDVASGNARLESCGNRVQIQLNPSSQSTDQPTE